MTPYEQSISQAIGMTDLPTIAMVEAFMRDESPTLDHLSSEDFNALAWQSMATARELHEDGQLKMICEAYQLTLPAWAS